jgi:hypothetical protein
VPAYIFKGIEKEIHKGNGRRVEAHLSIARKSQGYAEFEEITAEQRKDIVKRWHELNSQPAKKKKYF